MLGSDTYFNICVLALALIVTFASGFTYGVIAEANRRDRIEDEKPDGYGYQPIKNNNDSNPPKRP